MSWGAVAVAAVGAYSAYEGQRQSRRAASKQEQAAIAATNMQRAELERQREAQAPFQAAGVSALEQQQALTGLAGGEAQQQALEGVASSPGQQFLRDQQERALLRNASAIGGLGGGNVRTALQQQAFGRAQTDIANQFNRLSSISGAGQTATQNIGQAGSLAAANIGQLQMQAGAARASGILGQQQALQQGLSSVVGAAAQGGLFNQQQAPAQTTQPTSGFSVSGGAGLRPLNL
jgi:hypothetical protein